MKRLLIVAAISAIATAAFIVAGNMAVRQDTAATVTIRSAQVMDSITIDTNTPKPTRTPKPESTPTPDRLLQEQAQAQLQLDWLRVTEQAVINNRQSALSTATMAVVTADAIKTAIVGTSTQGAIEDADNLRTQTARRTEAAYSTQQGIMAERATADRSMTMTPAALEYERGRIYNSFLPWFGWLAFLIVAVAGGVFIYGEMRIMRAKHSVIAEELLTNREAREFEQEREAPEPVRYSAPDTYPAGMSRQLLNSIATDDQLATLARMVLSGSPLVHNVFTPTENLLSEGRFASLQVMLVKYGYAAWDDTTHKGGVTLTERGWRLMQALDHSPTGGGSPDLAGKAG